MNALKSGIYSAVTVIRGVESVDEYRDFARSIVADLGARTALEMALAERLCAALWRSKRVRRYEAETLSREADKAAVIGESAETLHETARTQDCRAKALDDIRYERSLSQEMVLVAGEAIASLYGETDIRREALVLRNDLEDLAYRKRVSRRSVLNVIQAANDSMPEGYRYDSAGEFLAVSAAILRKVSLKVKVEAAAKTLIAESAQTNALLLNRWEAARITDAERRADRQVSAALADYDRVRNGFPAQLLDARKEALNV